MKKKSVVVVVLTVTMVIEMTAVGCGRWCGFCDTALRNYKKDNRADPET